MSTKSQRFPVLTLGVTGWLVAGLLGCNKSWLAAPSDPIPRFQSAKATELKPGQYCEIDMVLPPTAPDGCYHHFSGKVHEVTRDEIVLVSAMEESRVEYATTLSRRPPTQQPRDIVRVPLTGVAEIAVPVEPDRGGSAMVQP